MSKTTDKILKHMTLLHITSTAPRAIIAHGICRIEYVWINQKAEELFYETRKILIDIQKLEAQNFYNVPISRPFTFSKTAQASDQSASYHQKKPQDSTL